MDRLRPRHQERISFSGFTTTEREKLEKLFQQYGVQTINREFCQRIARGFSRSAGRTGKPVVKLEEVQSWFQNKQQDYPSKVNPPVPQQGEVIPLHVISKALAVDPDACTEKEANGSNQDLKAEQESKEAGDKVPGLSQLEFEAKSSKDGACFLVDFVTRECDLLKTVKQQELSRYDISLSRYDVDRLLTHRFSCSGEVEVRVRFVGFGAEDDEWVNVKKCVRERSVPFEHSECSKVKVGDIVLCLQESQDQAIYYDAHIVEIQRKMHDIRGCRCIFLVRYNNDNTEEKVRLRRLCRILVLPSRN